MLIVGGNSTLKLVVSELLLFAWLPASSLSCQVSVRVPLSLLFFVLNCTISSAAWKSAALAPLLLAACQKKAEAPKVSYDLTVASNHKYLAENAAKPGVFKTADGLQYRIIKAGKGKTPQRPDDMVTVKYKGALINGKVFDQTKGEETAAFPPAI